MPVAVAHAGTHTARRRSLPRKMPATSRFVPLLFVPAGKRMGLRPTDLSNKSSRELPPRSCVLEVAACEPILPMVRPQQKIDGRYARRTVLPVQTSRVFLSQAFPDSEYPETLTPNRFRPRHRFDFLTQVPPPRLQRVHPEAISVRGPRIPAAAAAFPLLVLP
jgi:hypothetical protein